jgi:hypothetical protein
MAAMSESMLAGLFLQVGGSPGSVLWWSNLGQHLVKQLLRTLMTISASLTASWSSSLSS